MEVKSGRMFEKEILPFMEERIMKKLRTYNVYSINEYEDIQKAVRYSIRFCMKPVTTSKTVIEPDCYYEQALNEKNFRKRLKRIGLI